MGDTGTFLKSVSVLCLGMQRNAVGLSLNETNLLRLLLIYTMICFFSLTTNEILFHAPHPLLVCVGERHVYNSTGFLKKLD